MLLVEAPLTTAYISASWFIEVNQAQLAVNHQREKREHLPSSTLVFAVAKELRRMKDKAERAISIGQLSTLLCVHSQPINVVVFDGPLWDCSRET